MILRTESVEQIVDGDERCTLVKQVVVTPGSQPLGMVRKRLPGPSEPRGTVVLVHGFAQNRYTWHMSRRSFSAYLASRGWDVFNVDLRGHGRSRRFGAEIPRILDDYITEDLPFCVEEASHLSSAERVFLVGHSMGGLLSYAAAATSVRDRVRGIVTLGAPYRFGLGSRTLNALAQLASAVHLTGLVDSGATVTLKGIARQLIKQRVIWDSSAVPIPIRAWLPGSVERELLEEYLGRAFDKTSVGVALAIMRAGQEAALKSHDGSIDYGAAFELLDRPLLVVAGTHDALAPPASVRPAYDRSRSTDKSYRAFPFGHIDLIVGREAPRTVWPLIETWLSRR